LAIGAPGVARGRVQSWRLVLEMTLGESAVQATVKELAIKELEAAEAASQSPVIARVAAVRARFWDLLPQTMIGLGVVMTIAWTGSLVWMVLRLLTIV
jgi:hypothetical protein